MNRTGLFIVLIIFLTGLGLYMNPGLSASASFTSGNVTGLVNETGNFWINWTWTNPSNASISHVMIYIDGIWRMNTSDNFYNETFWAHASQTISTRTVDITGSINPEWVNQTTTVPNNPVRLILVPGSIIIQKGQIIEVVADYLDADGDKPAYYCNRTDLFTDFDITTGMGSWMANETGVYHIDFGVSDGYGSIDNTTLLVDVRYNPPPQSPSEGSGEEVSLLSEPLENVADKEVQYIWITNPEKENIVRFHKTTHSIVEIGFEYSQISDEVIVIIEKLVNSSTLANSSPDGVIYENDNIWVNVPNSSYISNATIRFRVDKTWILSGNINPVGVALFRFKDGVWNRLPTNLLIENETMAIYMASTPDFSPFAIAGVKIIEVSSPQLTTTPALAPADTPASGPASRPPSESTFSLLLNYVYLAVLIGGLMGFVVVTFLYFYTKPKNL